MLRLERFRLVTQLRAVALLARLRGAAAALDVCKSDQEDEDAAKQAEPRRGPGRRLEERRRDDVLDLRRARQGVHREGECTEGDRAWDEPLGDVALPEHLGRERINREHHHEQRDAAIGEDRAHQDDRQHRPFSADQTNDGGDDRLGKTGQLDDLAEHRPEHEHRKVVFHEPDHLLHEHAGEHRRDQGRVGQQHGAERGDWREQDHAVAAIGHEHKEHQRAQHDHEIHDIVPDFFERLVALRLSRSSSHRREHGHSFEFYLGDDLGVVRHRLTQQVTN